MTSQSNDPFKSRRKRVGIAIFAILVLAFYLFMKRSAQPVPEDPPTQTEFEQSLPTRPESAPESVARPGASAPARTESGHIERKESDQTISEEKLREWRSEAKMALASFYSSQKAFFAEYNRYSTDLKAVGWRPNERVINYKLGFARAFKPSAYSDSEQFREDPNRLDTDAFINEAAEENGEVFKYVPRVEKLRLSEYESLCKKGCTADESGFEILVAMPLGESGRIDVWTINDQKEMSLVVDGTKVP